MSVDLERLERLAKAATPGPWVVAHLCTNANFVFAQAPDCDMVFHAREEDVQYITEACNSAPELIVENRALRERVAEYSAELAVLLGVKHDLEQRVRELEEEGRTLGERLCETEHDLTEALDKKEELEGRIAELTQENSNQKRVIQMLEYRVLALKGKPIPMEPRSFIPSSNRSNAKESVQEAVK